MRNLGVNPKTVVTSSITKMKTIDAFTRGQNLINTILESIN